MNNTRANQTVNISYVSQDAHKKSVVLSDKYYEYEKRNPEANNKSYMGKGYLGVGPNPFIDFLPILKNPFSNFPNNFLLFYILPLLGLDGYNPIYSPFTDSYIITGPFSFIPSNVFWVIVNALYWIFWLNLAVGLFNVLPMIPLDGGFLFNDAIGSFIRKTKKNLSDERREKFVKNVSLVTSLLILFIVLFPWLVKYF
jgi:membrane-associated protease RseP (regulator of RpoE activity)